MSVDAASTETSLFSSVYCHKRVSAAQPCCFRTIQSTLCCAVLCVLCVVILTKCIHPMVTGMHCDVYLLRCITWHYGQGRATPSLDFPNERQDRTVLLALWAVALDTLRVTAYCIVTSPGKSSVAQAAVTGQLQTPWKHTLVEHCTSTLLDRRGSEALSFCFVWHLEIPWVCFSSSQVREGLQRDQTCLL